MRELAGRLREVGAGMIHSVRSCAREGLSIARQWLTDLGSGGIWMVLLRLAILGVGVLAVIKLGPRLWEQIRRLKSGSQNHLNPIRRKAGRWLTRINNQLAVLAFADPAPSDSWQDVLQDLRRIRYGRPTDWPDPQSVFRQARRLLKRT